MMSFPSEPDFPDWYDNNPDFDDEED